MSPFEWIKRVRSIRGLTGSQKLLLQTIATYSDAQGKSFPSIPRLMEDTGLSRRTVFYVLKQLKATPYLQVASKPGCSNVYQVKVSEEAPVQSLHPCNQRTRAIPALAPVQSLHPTRAITAPEESKEESIGKTLPPSPPREGGDELEEGSLAHQLVNWAAENEFDTRDVSYWRAPTDPEVFNVIGNWHTLTGIKRRETTMRQALKKAYCYMDYEERAQ